MTPTLRKAAILSLVILSLAALLAVLLLDDPDLDLDTGPGELGQGGEPTEEPSEQPTGGPTVQPTRNPTLFCKFFAKRHKF